MRVFTNRFVASAAVLSGLTLLCPTDARACGGFFCSSRPIDQTAEHILFTVNPDVTVTAIIQISFSGDKDDFAWIVPVPGAPKLDTNFPELAFQGLDTATQPQYTKNRCFGGERGFPQAADAGAALTNGSASPGVTVIAQQVVGPYDSTTLEGTSSDAVVQWLQNNGYRITDKMIPVLAPYVADGMKFVAIRLTPESGVQDITPLSMTYPGNQPMIPSRLTAVATQPEMGIVAWILGDERWAPDNYQDLKIPDKLIQFDQYGNQNNYLTVVSQQADKVGGEAFVTEYSKATTELATTIGQQPLPPPQVNPDASTAQQTLLTLLGKYSHITRLYTRISAEEMLDDPIFRVASDQTDVSNVHDLTDPGFSYDQCATFVEPPPVDPCSFNYCGRRGACTHTVASESGMANGTASALVPACACAADATARPTTTTNGQLGLYCEPIVMNFDATSAGGALTDPACEGFDCGAHGVCVGMNGNPTCRCDVDYGAVATTTYDPTSGVQKTVVTCESTVKAPALPLVPPPGQATLPASDSSSSDGGCSVTRRTGSPASSPFAWIAGALGAAFIVRRRRNAGV